MTNTEYLTRALANWQHIATNVNSWTSIDHPIGRYLSADTCSALDRGTDLQCISRVGTPLEHVDVELLLAVRDFWSCGDRYVTSRGIDHNGMARIQHLFMHAQWLDTKNERMRKIKVTYNDQH